MLLALFYLGDDMAQYDASIIIDTQIRTKQAQYQLNALETNMVKSAGKIDSLRSKLDLSKNIKLPTQEYKDIQDQISTTEKKIVDLTAKQERFLDTGGKVESTAYKRMQYDVEELRKSLSYLKGEEQDLIATGEAFTIGNPEQAAALQQQLDREQSSLDLMAEKRELLQSKIQAQSEEEQRLADIKENATIADQELVDLLEQRRQLLEQIKDLEKAGVTEGYQEYDTALADLSDVQNQINGIRDMRDAAAEARSSYVGLGESVKNAFATMGRGFIDIPIASIKAGVNGLVSAFQKLGTVAKNVAVKSFRLLGTSIKGALSKAGSLIGSMVSKLKTLGSTAKKSFGEVNKSAKKTSGLMGTIASRFKGIALSLLLFNWITKAFNGMIKSVKEGFTNLYKDNERFQNSVDNLKASILTLKNAFAAAFRPLVDIAIPYIQMAADRMTDLLNKVAQFTAAITGQKTYTRAIKQTADAFKEAKKAAEGYLSPLDEINKYSPKDEESDIKMGVMFEEAPVSAQFKDMAEKFKNTLSKAFTPIREAWEREGQFVIDSWKYGLGEVRDLLGSIGADFAKVWQQEKTVKIFENILHIIGDIGLTAGNLAHNFREAWEENETGLHTLENIRDIIGVITENVRHAADATVEWSKDLDFSPLLTKVQEWTESLIPVFDTLSGIVTDFYEKVLLPLGTWTIENGLPELLQVLIDFNNRVDWESLRTNLAEFWDHLEPFAETVGEGLIIFISRLAEALANFINSPAFSEFLTIVENWMDKVDPEDVANGFQKIATAILILKGASVAMPGISTGFSALSTAAKVLKGALTVLTPVITALKGALSLLASPIGIAAVAVAALAAGFIYLYNHCEGFKNSIDTLYNDHIKPFFDSVVEGLGKLKEKFMEFWDAYAKPMLEEWGKKVTALWEEHIKPALDKITDAVGRVFDSLKELWEKVIEPLAEWIIDNVLPVLLPIIDEIFNFSMDMIGSLMDDIGDLADIIADCVELVVDLLEGDWSGAWEKAGDIVGKIWDNIKRNTERAVGQIKGWINDLLSLFGKAESGSNLGSQSESYSNMARSMSATRFTQTPYIPAPIAQTLKNVEIPGYATGQVIPTSMKKHLAYLGDNNHETEVVSPLSTIRQALREEALSLGLGSSASSNQTVIAKLYLDGKQISEAVIKDGKVQQMSTGNNPFLLGTT